MTVGRKKPNAANDIYAAHLNPYNQNNAIEREARIERMYLNDITNVAINRFNWKGLPDEINERYLEHILFLRGLAVFYYDTDYDKYFAMMGAATSPLNMYNDPTGFTTYGNQYVSKNLSAYQPHKTYEGDEAKMTCVPIWSNYLRFPDFDKALIYAQRLANFDRSIEINAANARRSKVIFTRDETRLSVTNINRMIDQGDDVIQVNGAVLGSGLADVVQAVDMGINVGDIEKLHIVRVRQWGEIMGLLGINNANQDKKERLVADEVSANDEQITMIQQVNLKARRQAAKYIGEAFGVKIEVEYETKVEEMANQLFNAKLESMGGSNNGDVHDAAENGD